MQVSRNGLLFVACREALVLTAYQDGQHLSIGFGSNDPSLKEGDTISVREAFDRLRRDVDARARLVSGALRVEVEQHQFDALFSLFYQGGSDGYRAVLKLINDSKMDEAADEFLRWDTNAKGEHKTGLMRRRVMERRLFLNADYGDLTRIPFWRGNPRETLREEYVLKEGDL